jgi:prefoldin subunit 5
MAAMRFSMAICMAILGSCIFDQIIFRNDIQHAIQDNRENVISETINKRLSIYDSDIQRITRDMDSLSNATIALNEELQKRPVIKGTNVSTQEQIVGIDENGKPKKVRTQTVNTVTMANPLAEQLKANNDQIQIYSTQLEQLRQDKKEVAETVRAEINQRAPGFIEELEATLRVVSNSPVSLAFYIVLFCFLTSLELFVLTIKMGEKKCDYELIVEKQLYLKQNLMEQTAQSVLMRT